MNDRCPYAQDLECAQADRNEEFYLQMFEAMRENRPVAFVTGGLCPAYASECTKLREHKEKNQRQR